MQNHFVLQETIHQCIFLQLMPWRFLVLKPKDKSMHSTPSILFRTYLAILCAGFLGKYTHDICCEQPVAIHFLKW